MFATFAVCYIMGSLFLWNILKLLTKNFYFRQQAAPDESQANLGGKPVAKVFSASPVIFSAIIGAAFALPFISDHPAPHVGNWLGMVDRTSMLMYAYGLLSLVCWIWMIILPTLLTLYLAINTMIMCGLSMWLLLIVGACSPV